jgi:hypothetical protein
MRFGVFRHQKLLENRPLLALDRLSLGMVRGKVLVWVWLVMTEQIQFPVGFHVFEKSRIVCVQRTTL